MKTATDSSRMPSSNSDPRAATSSGQFERCACERRLHTLLLLPIAEIIPASPTRPKPTLSPRPDSVGNGSISCRSARGDNERQLFHLRMRTTTRDLSAHHHQPTSWNPFASNTGRKSFSALFGTATHNRSLARVDATYPMRPTSVPTPASSSSAWSLMVM